MKAYTKALNYLAKQFFDGGMEGKTPIQFKEKQMLQIMMDKTQEEVVKDIKDTIEKTYGKMWADQY